MEWREVGSMLVLAAFLVVGGPAVVMTTRLGDHLTGKCLALLFLSLGAAVLLALAAAVKVLFAILEVQRELNATPTSIDG